MESVQRVVDKGADTALVFRREEAGPVFVYQQLREVDLSALVAAAAAAGFSVRSVPGGSSASLGGGSEYPDLEFRPVAAQTPPTVLTLPVHPFELVAVVVLIFGLWLWWHGQLGGAAAAGRDGRGL